MTRSRDTADQINRINSSAANATAITVDSSENVSLTGALDVTGAVTSDALAVSAATNNYASITATNSNTRAGWLSSGKKSDGTEIKTWIRSEGDGGIGVVFTETNHNLGFATNNAAPQMTLDTSGNVLVGTNNAAQFNTSTETGSQVSDGYIAVARPETVAYFNRLSTDGDIVSFRKGGSTVGSIGTLTADPYIARANGCGVRFITAAYIPSNATGNNNGDAVDLGHPSIRFKDAYLSGGVYLGGTGAANKLDDYETGSFTPTMSGGYSVSAYSIQYGTYTKIGNTVRAYFRVSLQTSSTTASQVIISGLPFTAVGSQYTTGTSYINYSSANGDSVKPLVFPNSASVYLYYQSTTGVSGLVGTNLGPNLDILGQVVYQV